MCLLLLCALLALLHPTTSLPLQQNRSWTTTLTPQALIQIAPQTSACPSTSPPSCRTATQAAPALAHTSALHGITAFNTQAALIALILYESDNFIYDTNIYPGVPGQGTRNMQSPAYNVMYLDYLVSTGAIPQEQAREAQAQGPATVLKLVNVKDEWSFGSAAWFLTTQCGVGVREGLAQGTEQGWEEYLTGCVGTTVTEERTAVWRKAVSLGGW